MRDLRPAILAMLLLAAGCGGIEVKTVKTAPPRDTVVVYAAASLAAPMQAALEAFALQDSAAFQQVHGASLELARRITELHQVPDVIALADEEVFPQVLEPAHMAWHASFARNRMVVAYTSKSRHANDVTPANWWRLLQSPDVLVGRTDPELAPAGYRALLMYQLAESWYHQPGLAARLAARTPPALIRGNAADLAALLDAGELDYIVDYESLARSHRFRWIDLPPEINLGDANRAAEYAHASMRIRRGRDSVTLTGAPIRYGLAIPRAAPHSTAAMRFTAFLLGSAGQAILRSHGLDALSHAEFHGDSVPDAVRAAAH